MEPPVSVGHFKRGPLGAQCVACGKPGLVKPAKSPRLAATAVANTLTVATHAYFIGRGDLNR